MLVGPVGSLLLSEGPHEVVHHYQLQMQFLQFINPVHHLLYHEAMMDLSLGWTSIHQGCQIKGASLHPSLLSQCIEGGVIAELRLHNVGEAARKQDSKWVAT